MHLLHWLDLSIHYDWWLLFLAKQQLSKHRWFLQNVLSTPYDLFVTTEVKITRSWYGLDLWFTMTNHFLVHYNNGFQDSDAIYKMTYWHLTIFFQYRNNDHERLVSHFVSTIAAFQDIVLLDNEVFNRSAWADAIHVTNAIKCDCWQSKCLFVKTIQLFKVCFLWLRHYWHENNNESIIREFVDSAPSGLFDFLCNRGWPE